MFVFLHKPAIILSRMKKFLADAITGTSRKAD
jgi:hypothetical protein